MQLVSSLRKKTLYGLFLYADSYHASKNTSSCLEFNVTAVWSLCLHSLDLRSKKVALARNGPRNICLKMKPREICLVKFAYKFAFKLSNVLYTILQIPLSS